MSLSKDAAQCPVDHVTVNENKVRMVALFVLLIGLAYLATGYLYLIVFLVPDFLLRATSYGKNSLLGLLADAIVAKLHIKSKPTDRAPKRFAAGTGLLFTVLILVASLLNLALVSMALTIILVIFASLESFAGFCAGCYVYSILKNAGLVGG